MWRNGLRCSVWEGGWQGYFASVEEGFLFWEIEADNDWYFLRVKGARTMHLGVKTRWGVSSARTNVKSKRLFLSIQWWYLRLQTTKCSRWLRKIASFCFLGNIQNLSKNSIIESLFPRFLILSSESIEYSPFSLFRLALSVSYQSGRLYSLLRMPKHQLIFRYLRIVGAVEGIDSRVWGLKRAPLQHCGSKPSHSSWLVSLLSLTYAMIVLFT